MTRRFAPRTPIALIAMAALCSAAGPAEGGVGRDRGTVGGSDLWAIGYAVAVAQTCPAWTVEGQEVLAERGILPESDPASGMLRMDGPAERDYLRGQTDAAAAARRHARFCRNVRTIAGSRWTRLARVLTPRREDVP